MSAIPASDGARGIVNAEREMVRCQECQTPVAEFRNGDLLIKSRHHGEWHVTVVPREEVLRLVQETSREPACGRRAA